MAEKKIGARTFKCEPMLAMEALVLQARLFKALGPAVPHFGAVMAGYGTDKTEEEKSRSNASALGALAHVFASAEPIALANLVKDIAEAAMIKGDSGEYRPVDLDGDFTGNQKDLMPLILFVLREQFGDFFAGLPGLGSLGKIAKG